jgi:hypothetical protein
LLLGAVALVFVGQHPSCLSRGILLPLYSIIMLYVKQERTSWRKSGLPFTSRHASNGNWRDEPRRKASQWRRFSDERWIPTWRGMIPRMPHPIPPKQGEPFIPRINDGG